MRSRNEVHRKTNWKQLFAIAAAVSLMQAAVVGQVAKSQPTPTTSQAKSAQVEKSQVTKSQVEALPDLPANLAAKLKPVGNGKEFVVAAPRSAATVRQPLKPPVRQPSGGTVFALSCMHNAKYWVTAAYPVLICHPWIDDIRATTSGAIAAREAPAPSPTGSPAPSTARASSVKRPASKLEPETALSYRVRSSARGLLVCSYARMPVLAEMQKRNVKCDNPNAFAYSIDIAGVGLSWSGDPEMRPADLRLFDEPSCVSDTPTSCSGASSCTPLCGAGANPTPTPAPPPALR